MKKIMFFLLIVLMSGYSRRGALQPPSLELGQKQQQVAQDEGLLGGQWLLEREAEGITKLVVDTKQQQVIVTEKSVAVRSGLDAEIIFICNLEKIENSHEDVFKKSQVGNEIAEIYVEITKSETVSQQAAEELAYQYLDTITGNSLTAKASKQLVRQSD